MTRIVRVADRASPSTPTITSTTGFTILGWPRNSSSFPKNSAWTPTASCLARQAWLKNVTVIAEVVVLHVHLDEARPFWVRRERTARTSASTTASSPTARSERSDWRDRSR